MQRKTEYEEEKEIKDCIEASLLACITKILYVP
jgi:hypothetical protein